MSLIGNRTIMLLETYRYNTTEAASLRTDSPNTNMYRISLTLTSSNTAKTATGSTADINEPNSRLFKIVISTLQYELTLYKENPTMNVLKIVPHIAYRRIVPKNQSEFCLGRRVISIELSYNPYEVIKVLKAKQANVFHNEQYDENIVGKPEKFQ